jgi:hypothetical protein
MSVAWTQIKELFTEDDISMMESITGDLNLADCESVKEWGQRIYEQVSDGLMPPGDAWPTERVELFKQWMDEGSPCGA